MIAQDVTPNAVLLLCPVCGFDCVHPQRVEVFPVLGHVACVVTHQGVSIEPSDAAEAQRGISIELEFSCESGHVWTHELRFHKGATLIETTIVRDEATVKAQIDPETGTLPGDLTTIWRD